MAEAHGSGSMHEQQGMGHYVRLGLMVAVSFVIVHLLGGGLRHGR